MNDQEPKSFEGFVAGIIKAVLGPTNTGKTHYAVERMLAYASGMMGFPLRLLAREVYDRVVAVKGKNQVALLTGEERIVPKGARYFLCTAEAMPRIKTVDFVAIDEIQMAADPQRGHVFTEHLLHSRGTFETLFLGASTMRPLISRLIPGVEIVSRERFSTLKHIKPAKLSRLPRRSAIVAFSASDVYGMAELMRRQKGGAALVMGALSPRTRNAQVEMYQSGEVDHLIATDAIGMGLNLDVTHVSFASLRKFDGRTFRDLTAAEAAQIAGRAGRYQTDGTFSTLGGGDGDAMDPLMISQIEEHQFDPVKTIFWRNHRLDFSSIGALIRSLELPAQQNGLHRVRDSLDQLVLGTFASDTQIRDMATTKEDVLRLWDICQIPDFRKLSYEDHVGLLKRIYHDLSGPSGTISHDFIVRQVKHLDNVHGDIDTLAGRIASIRMWTYVSHRKGWLSDGAHWAHVTRSVEDRLSDALHERLIQRFVDRRTAVLMRSLRQRDALSVSIDSDTNQVSVEGHEIGELNGFSFRVDASGAPDEQKTLQAAAESALQIELTRRAKLFANVGYKTLEFSFSEGLAHPKLMWEGAAIATVHDSGALFAPRIKLVQNSLLQGESADLVREKAQEWLDSRIAEKLEPLIKLAQELNGEIEVPEGTAALSGLVRGVAYRLLEHYGVMPRSLVDSDLRQIDQDSRKGLRRFGIRIGASSLYIPIVMKPHATELRLMMWAMAGKKTALPAIPTPGMVWVETDTSAPQEFYELAGFQVTGKKAVRMDMLERLSDAVRPLGQAGGWFEVTPEIMGLVGLSGEDFAEVMTSAGYKHEIRKVSATPVVVVAEPVAEAAEDAAQDDTSSNEAPAEEAVAPTAEITADTVPDAVVEIAAVTETEEAEAPAEMEASAPTEETSSDEELVERYFFTWAPKRKQPNRPQPANRGAKRPEKANRRPAKKVGARPNAERVHSARPPKKEKPVDPDSPFAALAGLKDALSKKK
ncbi:helicase-related protein [Kordiimonas pumila]|uniref:Helicase-related protein n=1 Tax=Kordiimonas pumila TaxID=2161677 RepID=A0ABV7D484_9PROT|nr:helicase-related protein [Kordiimonas pumila]